MRDGRPGRGQVLRRPRARPGRARDDVDALPPQMLNTMVPHRSTDRTGRSPRRSTPTRSAATCSRCSPTAAPTGRATRTPPATRLHEHEMWAAEGLTHRYPTKVLAELLPTCPQYCGHCTRMDLVGNSTPSSRSSSSSLKPDDRLRRHARLPAPLARRPGRRGVRRRRGEHAVAAARGVRDRLLEIENIRDIRLATKALMGLPQHWLQDDVRAGMERWRPRPAAAASSSRSTPTSTRAHSVTPLVAEATGRCSRPASATSATRAC